MFNLQRDSRKRLIDRLCFIGLAGMPCDINAGEKHFFNYEMFIDFKK